MTKSILPIILALLTIAATTFGIYHYQQNQKPCPPIDTDQESHPKVRANIDGVPDDPQKPPAVTDSWPLVETFLTQVPVNRRFTVCYTLPLSCMNDLPPIGTDPSRPTHGVRVYNSFDANGSSFYSIHRLWLDGTEVRLLGRAYEKQRMGDVCTSAADNCKRDMTGVTVPAPTPVPVEIARNGAKRYQYRTITTPPPPPPSLDDYASFWIRKDEFQAVISGVIGATGVRVYHAMTADPADNRRLVLVPVDGSGRSVWNDLSHQIVLPHKRLCPDECDMF